MAKNDNPHALRLTEAIRGLHGDSIADDFAATLPLAKNADVDKKYSWACQICDALNEQYRVNEASKIRRACRCGDGKTMAREILGCIVKAGNLAGGCELFSQKNKYAFLEYVDEHEVVFGYHACVCSCIKRAAGNVPRLWCECSVGYAEAMFRQVFGDTAEVILLGSAKSGSSRCRFRVRW